MSYLVVFSDTAAKQFKKINNTKLKEKIVLSLEYIAKEPLVGKPLQAKFKGCYSYRIGDFRIIYAFYKDRKYLGILRIDCRKQVCK